MLFGLIKKNDWINIYIDSSKYETQGTYGNEFSNISIGNKYAGL